jgi:hypothetical protein
MLLLCSSRLPAIVISEIMYHPQTDEAHNEFVEIYNEQATRLDIGRWQFNEGIDFVFPAGTMLEPRSYLVIARDPATITSRYGVTNVVGPFSGALDNNSDHVILRDPAGGIMAEVDYADDGKWPVAADGAGHSLSKFNLRGDPNDPDNWRASPQPGGSPGRDNGFQDTFEDTTLIAPGDVWRYFKGTTEASTPITAWRQIAFDDSGPLWLQGPTGIGYSDGDDATILTDMQNNYWSIFCRKTFTIADPAAIDQLILQVDHDDGFVAYLNGTEVGSGAMPTTRPVTYTTPAINHSATVDGGALTVLDITSFKSLLVAGTNVLAVQVHNNALASTDLSFIPTLKTRKVYYAGQTNIPVVINEVRFHTSGTQFIELYNKSNAPVNIGGHYLSNDPDNLRLFQIAPSTMIAARSRIAFLRNQLGFAMNTTADRILFTSPSGTIVLDARAVEAGPSEMSEGRWPDGAAEWFYMRPTTGTANSVALTTSVVINEIMYHPPTNNVADEYVELYNAGATAVSLAGWDFSRGINFNFPTTATIGAGQYLVIAKDRDRLISRYGLSPSIVLGNFGGELSHMGEKIRLRDANKNVANEVTYSDGGHWSEYADGYGSSLELIDPRQDNSNYQAWAPSDETGKAQWTYFSYSGVVNTRSQQDLHELQFYLMGKGVALIDDIHLTASGTEYMANGDFESGIGNWLAFGDHVQSYVTTEEAHAGMRCLKIIATDTGDTGANHIEQDAQNYMTSGQVYTLSFWAKWKWGNRVLVTRCFDNQLMETHFLATPQITGTPGARNSVYRANLGPVFRDVIHSPVIPASGSPAHVTARVSDPDGVVAVNLWHKADSDSTYTSAVMWDDGLHGDGAAGDGLYGGDIPGRAAGQTVAFCLSATDDLGAINRWPTDISRPALYRVENAPLVASFPTYRIILTAADESLLFSRPHLSNEALNCTFIFDEKDIYYHCRMHYIGSPFHRSGSGFTGYKVVFNPDQKFHGLRTFARLDTNPGAGFYSDRISNIIQRWMGLSTCLLEYVYVAVNGSSRSVLEDNTPPGGLYLSMYYRGDDDGYMFEVDDRFEFTDGNGTNDWSFTFNNYDATFAWYGPDKDQYRNNYEIRGHDNEDDYTSMILLLNTLNNTPDASYDAAAAKIMNVEQWFRLFAIRACLSDWDFFALTRGKHGYLYWPTKTGKCDLLSWDSEFILELSRVNLSIWSNFATVRRFQQRPKHQHYYFNQIKEMLDKYFTHTALDPWIDYLYAHVGGASPSNSKQFIDQRRAYLLGQIPSAIIDITTNGGNPITISGSTVTLEGSAPVQVRWARVGGVEYYLDWTAATLWRGVFSVPPGTNVVTVEFLDYDKNLVGTDSITVIAPVPPTGIIVINSGAAYTSSSLVVLSLSATGPSPITQMRFSNDNTNWTAWEAYAAAKAWTLSGGDGIKTVYFQVKDTVGLSSLISNDAITLDTIPPTGGVVINGGAAVTNVILIALTLSAADSGSGVSQMRFSNNGSTWSAWEPYATAKAWTLGNGDGIKTVYFQVKDYAGFSSPVFGDTIALDTVPPTGGVAINGGAAVTNVISVTLTLSAVDSGSGVSQMRFSNDASTWSAWEPYVTTRTGWNLTSGDGLKTVYAQFRDGAGNASANYSDTITLSSGPQTAVRSWSLYR